MAADVREHLRWTTAFQLFLLVVGAVLWGVLRSPAAAAGYLAGGVASLAYWGIHWLVTSRMLTPSARLRWAYAFLSLGKLALIILVLHVIIGRYPAETLPLVTGVLLFVAGILLESLRLVLRSILAPPPE